MNTSVEKILNEVKKVIAGKDDVLEKIMMTVLSRGHVLLDDVPGTGKTTTSPVWAYPVHAGRAALGYRRFLHVP